VTLIRTETTYGLPSDPFRKIVRTFHLSDDGETLHVSEDIYARGYIHSIETVVEVTDDPVKP
jgi:hypothetical protein